MPHDVGGVGGGGGGGDGWRRGVVSKNLELVGQPHRQFRKIRAASLRVAVVWGVFPFEQQHCCYVRAVVFVT